MKNNWQIKPEQKTNTIDEILADLAFYLNPDFLQEKYKNLLDVSRINGIDLKKYYESISNIRWAWQKTLKYDFYFEEFYPTSDKIGKIEALNHHIHAYLQDMDTLKNKIEVFLGESKNDINKIAINKIEVGKFYKAGIEKNIEVFKEILKYRNPHVHRGMRFLDGDLLKAENAYHGQEIYKNPIFDGRRNQEFEAEFIAKLEKEKGESFSAAKARWIEMARNNNEQTSGFLNDTLKIIRPSLYQYLKIRTLKEIFKFPKENEK